ncbi:MAG: hypothetical protein K2H85_06325, partial [Allobaculum sp.]|nr:hypothetical protein [Allobaculum sp.]
SCYSHNHFMSNKAKSPIKKQAIMEERAVAKKTGAAFIPASARTAGVSSRLKDIAKKVVIPATLSI